MSGVAELQYHGLATGWTDAPQQAGITLDLSNYNVLCHVVHYELHSRLEEQVNNRERERERENYLDKCHHNSNINYNIILLFSNVCTGVNK